MLGSHIENYILAKQICIRSVLAQSWPNDFPGHKTKAGNRVRGRREWGRGRLGSTSEITYFHQNVEHLKMPIDEADAALTLEGTWPTKFVFKLHFAWRN